MLQLISYKIPPIGTPQISFAFQLRQYHTSCLGFDRSERPGIRLRRCEKTKRRHGHSSGVPGLLTALSVSLFCPDSRSADEASGYSCARSRTFVQPIHFPCIARFTLHIHALRTLRLNLDRLLQLRPSRNTQPSKNHANHTHHARRTNRIRHLASSPPIQRAKYQRAYRPTDLSPRSMPS